MRLFQPIAPLVCALASAWGCSDEPCGGSCPCDAVAGGLHYVQIETYGDDTCVTYTLDVS